MKPSDPTGDPRVSPGWRNHSIPVQRPAPTTGNLQRRLGGYVKPLARYGAMGARFASSFILANFASEIKKGDLQLPS